MASSTAFTYMGEYYMLTKSYQLVTVKGPHWPRGRMLFPRKRPTIEDGTEVDESAQEMLARIKIDAALWQVRLRTATAPLCMRVCLMYVPRVHRESEGR